MSNELNEKKVAILATNGFEHSELFKPKQALEEKGCDVKIISLESGNIKSWQDGNWGEDIPVDVTVQEANAEDYDALVLPGGVINPDILRTHSEAVNFVKDFFSNETQKPVAAICHGPWMLIEADVVKNRKATSYSSIKTDMINAGADWSDEEVVVDKGLITSRKPEDLDAFIDAIVEEIKEGRHEIPDRAQQSASPSPSA